MGAFPLPPLPFPGPYHPDAGPAFGSAPGALTSNNYLNQQLFNVGQFDQALAISQGPPGAGPFPGGANPMYPGSPLDFAYNYLNPGIANITGQINGALGNLPPPGQGGAIGAVQASEGGGGGLNFGGAVTGAAGGALVGAAGAVVGGVIGGIAGLFG